MVASFSGRSFFLRRGGLWPRMKCWWKHLKRLVKWSQRLHQWEKWNGKRQKEWILWTCYRSVLRAFYCRKNVDENIRQARCRRRSRRNEPIERDGEIIKKKTNKTAPFVVSVSPLSPSAAIFVFLLLPFFPPFLRIVTGFFTAFPVWSRRRPRSLLDRHQNNTTERQHRVIVRKPRKPNRESTQESNRRPNLT